jgi:hypothetical protein
MGQKIKLDGKEYEVNDLSDQAQAALSSLNFANKRMQELVNMQALLQRAKNSYLESLKREMISKKAGFLIEDE